MCNTYCFSTTTVAARTRLTVTLIRIWPVFFHRLIQAPVPTRFYLVPFFIPFFISSSLSLFSHPPLFLLHLFALSMAVPWLRRIAFGLWPRRVGFDPRPVRMGFVSRVAVWSVFLLVLRFSFAIFFSPILHRFSAAVLISPMLPTHSVTYHRRYILSTVKRLSVTRFKTLFPSSIKRTVGRKFATPVSTLL